MTHSADKPQHDYFTVERTTITIPDDGALAIVAGDAPKHHADGSQSLSLRFPVLLMPPDMVQNPGEIMEAIARILNEHAHKFFDSAKPSGGA